MPIVLLALGLWVILQWLILVYVIPGFRLNVSQGLMVGLWLGQTLVAYGLIGVMIIRGLKCV